PSMSDSQLYSRLLLPKRKGYPLFHPQPFDDLPEQARRTGTQIGDVGVITQDGSFDTIFNLTFPDGDSTNRFGVPANYKPVVLPTDDVLVEEWPKKDVPDGSSFLAVPSYSLFDYRGCIDHKPYTYLRRRSHRGSPFCPAVKVSTKLKQTALLVLPDGASSFDSRSLNVFRDYALKHAHDWYMFVNDDLQRMLGSGELYLVTGVTKSTSWGITAVGGSSGAEKVDLNFKAAHCSGETTREWESCSVAFHTGPYRRPGEEYWEDNQTVFIRGFKVAVR
ncbi:hypothetical protein C8R43DRAFT_857385, partial [Mycena crocata]